MITDVLIPSLDNRPYLEPCLRSLRATCSPGTAHVIVLNNGRRGTCDWAHGVDTQIVDLEHNTGWEGALIAGLYLSHNPLVLFCNDDVYFPVSSNGWLNRLVEHFRNPGVAAAGPSSNYVSGVQNMFADLAAPYYAANTLIGYCMLVRREALLAVGGVNASLPGGDDLDLSIRLVDAGYTLVADRTVFVYHHGSITGTRVHGSRNARGGWNSPGHTKATVDALCGLHGSARVMGLWGRPEVPYQPPKREHPWRGSPPLSLALARAAATRRKEG